MMGSLVIHDATELRNENQQQPRNCFLHVRLTYRSEALIHIEICLDSLVSPSLSLSLSLNSDASDVRQKPNRSMGS